MQAEFCNYNKMYLQMWVVHINFKDNCNNKNSSNNMYLETIGVHYEFGNI